MAVVIKTCRTQHHNVPCKYLGFYDDSHFVLSEMNLDKQHEWCGLRVSEITMSEDSLIVMIKRQGRILIPNGRLRLKEGDVLVVTSG